MEEVAMYPIEIVGRTLKEYCRELDRIKKDYNVVGDCWKIDEHGFYHGLVLYTSIKKIEF